MKHNDKGLYDLARLLFGEDEAAVLEREEMEAILAPSIRLALRTGRGEPALVNWVQRHRPWVAAGSPFDPEGKPERIAPRLARLLVAQMLQQVRAGQVRVEARETVAVLG